MYTFSAPRVRKGLAWKACGQNITVWNLILAHRQNVSTIYFTQIKPIDSLCICVKIIGPNNIKTSFFKSKIKPAAPRKLGNHFWLSNSRPHNFISVYWYALKIP